MAAVSARKILVARDKEQISFFSIINCLSFSEKSPSGPIRTHTGPRIFFDKISFKLLFSQLMSQKIKHPFFGN